MDRENRAIVPNGMFKFHITDLRFAGEDGQPLWETFERQEKDTVTDRVRAECCYISLMEVKTGNRYVWCIPCGEGKEFFQSDPEELAVQFFNDRFGTSFVDGRCWQDIARLCLEGQNNINGWIWNEGNDSVFRGSDPRSDAVPVKVFPGKSSQLILRESGVIRYAEG